MRREKRLSSSFNLFHFKTATFWNAVLFSVLAVSFSACNNIGSLSKLANINNANLGNPVIGNNTGNFILVNVLPSQQVSGAFDVIGQNQQFNTYCNGTYGACKCEFTYIQNNVGSQTPSPTAPLYQEANLIRCQNNVPAGISNFNIRIVVDSPTAPGSYPYVSNSLPVTLSGGAFVGSASFLDLTNAQSYVQAKRFQCRKREFIANPLDVNIIDPFQSEDPAVNYAFNFYTTNVGESLLKLQQAGNIEWDCSLIATQDHSLQWWVNPNVYSASPCTDAFCAGDSELMYPQNDLVSGKIPNTNPAANGKRRGSFWLASQPYGVFTQQVVAAAAPKDYVSAQYSVIGYGAKPIANVNGSSSCPNITLPPKSQWVKLWHFRADIQPAKVVQQGVTQLNSGIACNTVDGSFASCDKASTSGGAQFGRALSSVGTSPVLDSLSSRVVVFATQGATGVPPDACYNVTTPWAGGVETWLPSPFGFDTNISDGFIQGLFYGLYTNEKNRCTGGDGALRTTFNPGGGCSGGGTTGNPSTPPTASMPQDFQLNTQTLNNGVSYTDQLFIVSDPNVSDASILNQAGSGNQYLPVTYRSAADCAGLSRAACNSGKAINWQVLVKEVGNANSADVYPLCVLQFYD